jgi:hypothetical protein
MATAHMRRHTVMAGLVPAIHVLRLARPKRKDVDARHKAGHDDVMR